eukprot:scaffold3079_cov187-Ochromonas_danica.AAC.7
MAQAGSAWKETLPGFLKVAFLMLADHTYAVSRRLGMAQLLLGIGLLYYADYAQRKDFTFFKRTPSMEPVKKFPSVGRKISNNNKVIAGKNSSALGAFSTDDDHHEKRKGKELLGMKAISNSASKELVTLSTNSQVVVSSNSSSGNNDMDEERIKERIRFVEKLAEMDRYSVYNGKIV